jgi:hypothetical protein
VKSMRGEPLDAATLSKRAPILALGCSERCLD